MRLLCAGHVVSVSDAGSLLHLSLYKKIIMRSPFLHSSHALQEKIQERE
jgi:hypothetical protein